jgi:copper resistance protein D
MTGLAVIRAIHFAAAIQVIGALQFCWLLGHVPRSGTGAMESSRGPWLMHLALFSVAVVVVSGIAWFALQVTDMTDGSLTAAWKSGVVHTVLFKTHAGTIWWVRLAILAALAIVLVAFARLREKPRRAAIITALALAVANLTSCAWLSHAAADQGPFGTLHLGIHAAHMLAASFWLGGLFPLAMLLWPVQPGRDNNDLAVVHHVGVRFGNIALFAVAVIVLTGIANTALLVQDASDLTSGAFAKLLAAKLLLLLLMLVLAGNNRQWLLPRLASARPSDAVAWLRRSVLGELALGAAVLLIAGALGITPPGGSAE